MNLAEMAKGRENNLNLLRVMAATVVLISHSYVLLGLAEPFKHQIGISPAHIAVDIFFIVSGFLISASLISRGDFSDFIVARFLRIYPALLVMTLLCALLLGPLVSNFGVLDYFSNPRLWSYIVNTATLINSNVQYDLPGVFESVPYRGVVNGSLWTMPYEIRMYALLSVMWGVWVIVSKLKKISIGVPIVASAIVGFILYFLSVFNDVPRFHAARFVFMFFTGAAYWVLRHKIKISLTWFFVALSIVIVSAVNKDIFFWGYNLSLAYLTFCLAFAPVRFIQRYSAAGDYSYGIYIYAFPVQQTVVFLSPDVSVVAMMVFSGAITLALAIASWHIVEQPALARRLRLSQIFSSTLSRFAVRRT